MFIDMIFLCLGPLRISADGQIFLVGVKLHFLSISLIVANQNRLY